MVAEVIATGKIAGPGVYVENVGLARTLLAELDRGAAAGGRAVARGDAHLREVGERGRQRAVLRIGDAGLGGEAVGPGAVQHAGPVLEADVVGVPVAVRLQGGRAGIQAQHERRLRLQLLRQVLSLLQLFLLLRCLRRRLFQ